MKSFRDSYLLFRPEISQVTIYPAFINRKTTEQGIKTDSGADYFSAVNKSAISNFLPTFKIYRKFCLTAVLARKFTDKNINKEQW